MENNTELQKLLEKLDESNRRQVTYARLQFLFSAIAAVCCLVLAVNVVGLLPQIQEIATEIKDITLQVTGLISQAETVLTNLEVVTKELAEVDLASMVSNVDTLVTTSQTGVEQAIGKINNIDFDALNRAITNLSAVVEPMAKFFKVFK